MAYLRKIEITVGPKGGEGFKIDGLKIAFNIEKTECPEPNVSKVQIYNLSKETSAKVCIAGNHITVKAGYEDEVIGAIFFGDVLKGDRHRDGNDFVTELEVMDGRAAVMAGQVSLSYEKETDAATIAQDFLSAIGLPFKGLELVSESGETYPHGHCYIGMATDGLRDLLNRCKLMYTIQNEMVYIMRPGESADNTGLKLTVETGLITTPQPISDKTAEGDEEKDVPNAWKFSTLLFPQLVPGAACKVESSTLNGEVKITKSVFTGDNWVGDFRVDVEVEEV